MRWIISALLAATLACLASPANSNTTISVPASAGWVDTGIDVTANQRLAFFATGIWSNGGSEFQLIGSGGFENVHLPGTFLPSAPLASLIGQVGGTTFAIGDREQVRAPAAGRLFLAMNDLPSDLADNTRALTVLINENPLRFGIDVVPQRDFMKAEDLASLLKNIMLSGSRVQISQTENGQSIMIPNPPGLPRKVMSYVAFGPYLSGLGLTPFALDIPEDEMTPDELLETNTGEFTLFVEWFLSHSTVLVHKVRFLANNIHGDFDRDLSIHIGDGEVVLQLALQSSDPSIRGEGDGYTFMPFGIPIPLGWEDSLAPDISVNGLRAIIRIRPELVDGKVLIPSPKVELEGEPVVSLADFVFESRKKKMMEVLRQKLEAELGKPTIRAALENSLQQVLMSNGGGRKVRSFDLSAAGLEIAYESS